MLVGEEHKEYMHERIFQPAINADASWRIAIFGLFTGIFKDIKEHRERLKYFSGQARNEEEKCLIADLEELLGVRFSGEVPNQFVNFSERKTWVDFEDICNAIDTGHGDEKPYAAWSPYVIVWKKWMVDFRSKILTDPVATIAKIDTILRNILVRATLINISSRLQMLRELIQSELQNASCSK